MPPGAKTLRAGGWEGGICLFEIVTKHDMTVVVYDAPSQMMGMVACAFLYYGHTDVRLLDGGLAKWSRENRPVSTQVADYPYATFVPNPAGADLLLTGSSKSGCNRSEDRLLGRARQEDTSVESE